MSDINGVMMQYFHWYLADHGTHWNEVREQAESLAEAGITALWLPPATKGSGGASDVGYGVYDLFDLGEFNQKGTIRTKYGTADQYLAAIQALHSVGIQVYADAVLNHKMGGDALESMRATPFPKEDRLNAKGSMRDVSGWTHFSFPGRGGTYSSFEWHWWHFDAIDYDDRNSADNSTVYLMEGHQFDDYVALEKGNYAFLMGCDLDFQNEWVRGEISHWGKWYLDKTNVDGFRLDAIKHISSWFFPLWLDEMEKHAGKDLFVVGEYWNPNLDILHWYIDAVGDRMSVFDVPLHYNFHYASRAGGYYDMRRILDGTVMEDRPLQAVTFVDNHDSQPLQALESVVEPWFKPLAYAIILLRAEGYPCIFHADYYGAEYEDVGSDGESHQVVMASHRWLIDRFLFARKHHGYGPQYDYLDHWNTIGWTRLGDEQHPQAMAVIMSDGPAGSKWMEVGQAHARFVDLTEHIADPVFSNEWGWAEFRCNGGSVSVWVQE